MIFKKNFWGRRMQGRQTEQMSAEYLGLDTWPDERALAAMLDAQSRGVAAVRNAFADISKAAALVADKIRGGGRLIYAGAGSSGLIAKLDAHELPATFGIPHKQALALIAGGSGSFDRIDNKMEDSAPQAVADLAAVKAGPSDVVIGIAASGSTIYTCAALVEARRLGCATVGIACNDKAPIFKDVDVAIRLLSGPEVLAGSTRMAAGSAQKAALNLLSTLAAIKLGHVYDGMMVNMRAENEKLRERAAHIVARAAKVDLELARAKLVEAKFEPKIAILLAAGAKDGADAAQLLQQEQGNLRRALACLGAAPCQRRRHLQARHSNYGTREVTQVMRTQDIAAAAALGATALGGRHGDCGRCAASADDVTLTIESWRNDDLPIWQDKIIPAFEKANPGIKVRVLADRADRIQRRAQLQARCRHRRRPHHLPAVRRLAGAVQEGPPGARRPTSPGMENFSSVARGRLEHG